MESSGISRYLRADVAAALAAVVMAAPLTPVRPAQGSHLPPTLVDEIRLTATVPPAGLITSFVHNQTIYCSIICPLLAQTGVTAISSVLAAPGVFLADLPADGLLKAFGAAAASVTAPTDAAMEKAIAADAAIPAKRALNAFEVGVVGVLDIIPALAGGPAAVLAAIARARQQTFDALNAPVVPNPTPTVIPHGVLEVAVVQAINVVGAVIFPAFNDVLAGVFQVPDSVAQELAASGNPVRALVAGARRVVAVIGAAGSAIAAAVRAAITAVQAAARPAATSTRVVAAKSAVAVRSTEALVPVSSTVASKPLLHREGTPRATSPSSGTHLHPRVRGSHDARPSRPALRAKR